MHETKFVNEILTILRNKLGKSVPFSNVVVNVRLSPFSHVTSKRLRETFKELSKESAFENIRLNINPLDLTLNCRSCKKTARIIKPAFICPHCNSNDINIEFDKEFFIESVESQNEDIHG